FFVEGFFFAEAFFFEEALLFETGFFFEGVVVFGESLSLLKAVSLSEADSLGKAFSFGEVFSFGIGFNTLRRSASLEDLAFNFSVICARDFSIASLESLVARRTTFGVFTSVGPIRIVRPTPFAASSRNDGTKRSI